MNLFFSLQIKHICFQFEAIGQRSGGFYSGNKQLHIRKVKGGNMIAIKAFYGDWKEVTEAQAISFYNTFCSGSTALTQANKENVFNKSHIKGATIKSIYSNGKLEPKLETEAQKKVRIFNHYKQYIMSVDKPVKNTTRFNVIEYLCRCPEINPYEMAASILKDGWKINFDDSSITTEENNVKRRKVEKLLKLQEV